MMGNGGLGMGFGGPFLWVLIIIAVVLLVPWLYSQTSRGSGPSKEDRSRNRALAILEERYARGEIDREEFEHKRQDLGR